MPHSYFSQLFFVQRADNGPYPRPRGLRDAPLTLLRRVRQEPRHLSATTSQRLADPEPDIPPDAIFGPRVQPPRKINRPLTKLLIDTRYPTKEDYDNHDDKAHTDVLAIWKNFPPSPPRYQPTITNTPPSVIIQPDFVIAIDGTRTLKRRAQDTELDLVAAGEGVDQPRRAVATAREGSTDANVDPQDINNRQNRQSSMLGFSAIRGQINKMMSKIYSAITGARETVHRLINPRAYEIAELRSAIDGGNVRNKRVKLTPANQGEISWINNEHLGELIKEAQRFRQDLALLTDTAFNCEGKCKVEVNRILRPLMHILAGDSEDLRLLNKGAELAPYFRTRVEMVVKFVDIIYEVGFVVKLRDSNRVVPSKLDYGLAPSDVEIINRIKSFLAAPALPTVCKDLVSLFPKFKGMEISTSFMDTSIRDLEAMSHSIPAPSLIGSPFYRTKCLEAFPNPPRNDYDHNLLLPGGFPEQNDELVDEEPPVLEAPAALLTPTPSPEPEPESPEPEEPTPPPSIAKTNMSKTARLRAGFLASDIAQITAGQYRAKFYKENEAHEKIKDTYVTDFEPKEPLKPEEIRQIRSILKVRSKRSPKRLHITRATPLRVRFTDSTVSPQPRTHIGLNVPKLNENGFVPVAEPPEEDSTADILSPVANAVRLRRLILEEEAQKPKVNKRARIAEIFAMPSVALTISDDKRADIAFEKEQAERKAAEEARRAAEEARLAAEEQAKRELEERLAKTGGLRLPTQSLVSPVNEDWTRRARDTLRAASTTILATTPEGAEIRRHDFLKVVPPTEWLNDEIVNGSLVYLDQAINSAAGIKDVRRKTRKCLTLNSFFFKRLREQGVARTERTMRRNGVDKNNFLDVETIFMPICERSHWTLLVICPSKKTVAHMDSLNPRGSSEYINLGLAWVKEFLGDKYEEQEWKVMNYSAPLQTNGYDCGVHTITNAMCIALGLSPIDSYTAGDMPKQRIRVACMLLNGGFKGDFDLRVY